MTKLPAIFISYRENDTDTIVGRLADDLAEEFSAENIFRDKNNLEPGQDWPKELEGKARGCLVMLVIIGGGWEGAQYKTGKRKGRLRLDDETDWVRREITTGLSDEKIIVIPVLVEKAEMPDAEWLGECGLGKLHEKQRAKLRGDPDYSRDLADLITLIRKKCPGLPEKPIPVSPLASPPPPPASKKWEPLSLFPLQPAPYFAGREKLLPELAAWARDHSDPARVVALVAPGGTGKTALAERVLASLADYDEAGVFVWSFYENPQTEAFLRAACEYIRGDAPKETGGLFEALQRSLAGTLPHLFILDGLERVQAEGLTGRPRGELEDPLMRRFVRWLAAGSGTHARTLITTRFPMPDLDGFAAFTEKKLEDLEEPAAMAVLRGWKVKGTDEQLRDVLRPLEDEHTRKVHALSVSVLGSYLGKVWGGDPSRAPKFDPKEMAKAGDAKARKLASILTSYAERLSATDRDLLARLSTFPRGVTVEIIGYLIDAGGEVAGHLVECNEAKLLYMLNDLRELGLVFRYDTTHGMTFTAHPFVREFFEKLHGVSDPTQIHEAVRKRLEPSLEKRPDKKPTDPGDLSRYERLVEITRMAGKIEDAFELYWFGLGGVRHLGWVQGDYGRGVRILSGFATDGTPGTANPRLSDSARARLVADWGLLAVGLGDLTTARQAFDIQHKINEKNADRRNLPIGLSNLAEAEQLAGRWPKVREAAQSALTHAEGGSDDTQRKDAHSYLAQAFVGLGEPAEARHHFAAATALETEPLLYSLRGIWEAEFKHTSGDVPGALAQSEANRAVCARNGWTDSVARSDATIGRCLLPDAPDRAKRHLASARRYTDRSGNVEVALRCYHLAAELARCERDFASAAAEAESGIQLGDSSGFCRWSLDLRVELAGILIEAGEPTKAIEHAEWVLKRSREEDCRYAWGIADALHLLGVAHARLGNRVKARDYLREALAARIPLAHTGLADTRTELDRVL